MQKPSNTTGYISYSKRKDIHTECPAFQKAVKEVKRKRMEKN